MASVKLYKIVNVTRFTSIAKQHWCLLATYCISCCSAVVLDSCVRMNDVL